MLEIRGVSKSYSDVSVLKEIDFSCHPGSFHSIIGPSGTGKTTLLRIIGGLEEPDKGQIILHDHALITAKHQLVPGYEEIKVIHQDYQLKAIMSVSENLNYALIGFDQDYKEDRIATLLKLCHLEHLADRPSSQLSGGQKQRVAIARALATEPEVLLMDEPFSNLDPLTKNTLLQETREIANQTTTTIILVTHDTRDALEVADVIHIMIDGHIEQSGPPKSVYQNPDTPTIASLLGYMNFIRESDRLVGYWAEDIQLNHGGYAGTVENTIFKGAYQLLKIRSTDQKSSILAFDYQKKHSVNDRIYYEVDPSKKIDFGPTNSWAQWLLDQ
jgi:ABC-type Fe3+/spermidine/putrescine transport system ATPase subunit